MVFKDYYDIMGGVGIVVVAGSEFFSEVRINFVNGKRQLYYFLLTIYSKVTYRALFDKLW